MREGRNRINLIHLPKPGIKCVKFACVRAGILSSFMGNLTVAALLSALTALTDSSVAAHCSAPSPLAMPLGALGAGADLRIRDLKPEVRPPPHTMYRNARASDHRYTFPVHVSSRGSWRPHACRGSTMVRHVMQENCLSTVTLPLIFLFFYIDQSWTSKLCEQFTVNKLWHVSKIW